MDDKVVAKLIKDLMGKQSQRDFASKAGVQPMSISRWMNGTKINLVDFEKLCLAADRKIHEVLNFKGVTASLQKEFNVPEEYSLSIKELLKELLELQQENYQSQNSDNFIKLFTRHIRETKETLRSMKAKPGRWLSITDWTEKITLNSSLKLIIPQTSKKKTSTAIVLFFN
jgi:transcriptional regulator with XRE-family HTH domain